MKFSRKRESIGIDLGTETVKLIQLKPLGRGRFVLSLAESFPLPKEEKEIASKLKNYIHSQQLEGMSAALAFQDENLHIRPMELPRMPQEDLLEAIRWQMRDIAEGSMEDYAIRYSMIEEKTLPDIVRLHLLGYALKKEIVQKQVHLLQQAGLRPLFVEPTPVALAATVERIYPSQERGWTGCADLGKRRPYFLVTGKGKLHFVRPLPGLAGQDILAQDYPSKLSVELQHVLDAFFIAFQTEKIERIFLTGGGAENKELPSLLAKNLGISTERLNSFQGIEEIRSFPIAMEKPYLFGAALGSALLKP